MRSLGLTCLALLLTACVAAPQPSATPLRAAPGQRTLRVLVTQVNDKGIAGSPISTASVCAAPSRGTERCAETASDGVASFTLDPGVYSVRTEGPEKARWMPDQRTVDVIGTDAAIWIGLAARYRILGVILDQDSKPVARAEACATPTTKDPQTCARSGSNGAYAIEVRAGIYRLHVDGPPGGKLVPQWARGRTFMEAGDILDARATDVTGVDVALARGVVLRGTIRLAGSTIEDAQVCTKTLAAPLPWECERTDKRGGYAVLREPGEYWVWAIPPDRVRAIPVWYDRAPTGVNASPFSLADDATLDISLINGPQLRGKVRTSTGEPVADALVCVDTPFASGRICRPSGADGSYAITTRPEQYIVNVIPPAESDLIAEYWSHKRDWTEADRIRLSISDFQLDLVLLRGVVVRGMLTDKRGVPIAGATLSLRDDDGYAAATDTDETGAFRMAVRPGEYQLSVTPPFYANLVGREMDVDARGSVDVDVVLDDVTP